jgi:hypothetical protein
MPEHEKNCFDRPDNGKNQAKLTSNLTLRVLCPACLKNHKWGQKDAWIYDRGKLTKFKIGL